MRLWLDDVRPAPDGWHWVKSVDEARAAFLTWPITEASLDHDLGYVADPNWDGDAREPREIAIAPNVSRPGADGIDLVRWMCEVGMYPTERVIVHSWNPAGAKNMADALRAAGCPCAVLVDPFRLPAAPEPVLTDADNATAPASGGSRPVNQKDPAAGVLEKGE